MFYKYPSKIIEAKVPEASHHKVFPGACAQEDPGADQSQLLQGVGFGGDFSAAPSAASQNTFLATPRLGWQQTTPGHVAIKFPDSVSAVSILNSLQVSQTCGLP
jgi:hypothetical protein